MPRPSRLEAFLKSFAENQRGDIEREILRCADSKAAHTFLKARYKYRGSYDSVKNWRQSRLDRGEIDRVSDQASRITAIAAKMPLESDPIASVMSLAQELNCLCIGLTALLQQHQWLEPGETRLSNREAGKILGTLAGLTRASTGTILEMARLEGEFDKKAFALGLFSELAEDWRRTLEHDNPELICLLEPIVEVTKSRLQIDRSSLLEVRLK